MSAWTRIYFLSLFNPWWPCWFACRQQPPLLRFSCYHLGALSFWHGVFPWGVQPRSCPAMLGILLSEDFTKILFYLSSLGSRSGAKHSVNRCIFMSKLQNVIKLPCFIALERHRLWKVVSHTLYEGYLYHGLRVSGWGFSLCHLIKNVFTKAGQRSLLVFCGWIFVVYHSYLLYSVTCYSRYSIVMKSAY